ncbi:hypothetical protein [Morganella psychrotolerans]|uniref:Lipoprotein n=1 Tax=Morganella psychrotolerans TaxID=368603 RepID=A0A1B8HPR3_9GAMM|nr:hypothetical protein [Morganella psychrotolerans]OBU11486.1 hypothetical protein AYY17_01820 [Morganella psychrotolerans]
MKKLLLITVFTLAGCATSAVNPDLARVAPKDRVFTSDAKSENTGSVTVIRDSGMVGGGCFATVFIDGERAAKLDPSEKTTFNVKEGEHILGASLEGRGLCSSGAARQEREFNINSGDNKYYRIFTDQNGNMDIKPTTLSR